MDSGGTLYIIYIAESYSHRIRKVSNRTVTAFAANGNYLVTLPSDATISPTEPGQIIVQPVVNGLASDTCQVTLAL